MARLFITPGSQNYGPVPGGDVSELIGSNSFETVTIAANGNATLDSSFVRGNDCIKINGLAGDYLVQGTAAGIILTGKAGTPSAGAVIRIPAFGPSGGLKIDFSNISDVDLSTSDGTTFVLNGPGSADQTVTGTASALTIAAGSGGGGGGGSGDVHDLTVAGDNLTGGSGDTTFFAIVEPNQNGEQTNTLQSGDRLDGGGGFNTLDAEVQDASALNGNPIAEVVLRTTRIDHLKINAEQANRASDDDAVELDAERAYGVQAITSSFSDASLVVYNVNTMGDGGPSDPTNGLDNGRPTASIEICMDHTSGANVLFCASDFEVYFDADYLIPGLPSKETVIRLQLMDIDNSFLTNQPLLTNPYDRIFIDLPGVAAGSDPIVIVNPSSFTDTGVTAYNKLVASINAGLSGAGLTTFSAKLGPKFAVVDPDGNPGGGALIEGWEIIITDTAGTALTAANIQFGASGTIPSQTDYQKQIFVNTDTTTDLITSILCVEKVGQGGEGGDFIVGSMSTGGVERFILEMKGNDAGTGGVNVDQDSSLASLYSTNNTLREVILWAESDVTADITIGNGQTNGFAPGYYYGFPDFSGGIPSLEDLARGGPDLIYELLSGLLDHDVPALLGCNFSYDPNGCDLTTARNNAMRDVQLFTAAGAQGKAALNANVDVTLYAHLSSEFTPKYLNLMDPQVDAKADNVQATYLFSGGNDHLNMNISKANLAFVGAATREDFSFFTDTGAGNDLVELQLGDGDFGRFEMQSGGSPVGGSIEELSMVFNDSSHWYTNHLLNANVSIITGTGNDKVVTWGSSAAYIELGAGDDIVFTDNSGGGEDGGKTLDAQLNGQGDFNCCRATWVFNAQSDIRSKDYEDQNQVNDLLSFGRAQITGARNLSIFIQYQDLVVQGEVGGSWNSISGVTVTDLTINQAIKALINGHSVLSSFLEAKDGPSGTLLVLSKVDGQHLKGDLSLQLGRWSANGVDVALTPAQVAFHPTNAGLSGPFTAAALADLGFGPTGLPVVNPNTVNSGTGARWDSEFGYDGAKQLEGVDSYNVNNNRVYGGTGSDDIALSSNYTSIEHIIIKKDEKFGTDYIMNFSAAVTPELVEEKTECQEICLDFDGLNADVADQPFLIVLSVDDNNGGDTVLEVNIGANATATDILNAIEGAIDGSASLNGVVEASIDTKGTESSIDDCVLLTYESGEDFDLVEVVVAQPREIQYLDITGSQTGPATIIVTVPGPTTAGLAFVLTIADGVTMTQEAIAAALAGLIDADPLLTATVLPDAAAGTPPGSDGEDVIQITSYYTADIGETTASVSSPAVTVNIVNTAPNDNSYAVPPSTGVDVVPLEIKDGAPELIPALGYDIFDLSNVLGMNGPNYFHNDMQDSAAGAEYFEVDRLVDQPVATGTGVLLIDTLDGGAGEFAYSSATLTEEQRLQEMVTAADNAGQASATTSVIITVRNQPAGGNAAGDSDGLTGNFYQVVDGVGAGDAKVTYLGTVVLLGYDDNVPLTFKEPIGNWDAMTALNFTWQSPTQLMDTYVGGILI